MDGTTVVLGLYAVLKFRLCKIVVGKLTPKGIMKIRNQGIPMG